MALKKCQRCGEEKNTAAYIAVKSIMFGGSLPICRQCLMDQLNQADKKGELWNVADKMCQWADIPFVPEKFDEIYRSKGKDAIGTYMAIFRTKPYNTLDWKMYNDAYLQVQEENRVEDALPNVRAAKEKKLKQKWGKNYDQEELEYLENLHIGLLNSQNVVGALNEDQALKLCKISLIIENKIRAGEEFDKDLRAYDSLSKLANLTPKVVKDANELNSSGELFAYLEKRGVKIDYYDEEVRDEADFALKDIKMWNQALYVGETGVAEEIEQRIENLKVAAQLSGINFDEKEFRDYLKEQGSSPLEEEDFKIDIWDDEK